jgi:hypothetical protein
MFDKVEDFTKPNGFRINTNNELSNFDIIKIIENMKLTHVFGGVYSKDQLPTLQRNKFYIINLESSDAGRDSHWTVFFYNKPLTSIYYDSFGFIAPLEVVYAMHVNAGYVHRTAVRWRANFHVLSNLGGWVGQATACKGTTHDGEVASNVA